MCAPATTTRLQASIKQLLTLGLKKVAVFRQNDSYGQAGLDGVVRR